MPTQATQNHAHELAAQGFTVIRNQFSPAEVQHLRGLSDRMSAAALDILEASVTHDFSLAEHAQKQASDLIVVPEANGATTVCRYEYMCGFDKAFSAFVDQSVLPIAEAVIGAKVSIFKDKTNEKLPGGGAFGPHQDHEAYKSFGPKRFVTALISIDPATPENGCLEFAPAYKSVSADVLESIDGYPLFKSVREGAASGEISPQATRDLEWVSLATDTTDLVFFDSFVPHKSSPNLSSTPRRAIFITMNTQDEGQLYNQYYAEKRRNYSDPKFHVATPTAKEG